MLRLPLAALAAFAAAHTLAAAPVKIAAVGEGPNLAVDSQGRWHVIYHHDGTYRYVIFNPGDGTRSAERDVGFGVERGSLDRGYGHIAVDARGAAHVFTGMGYAHFAAGEEKPTITKYERRDPAMAMDDSGRVLLVMRGRDDKGKQFAGPGTILGAIVARGERQPGPLFDLDAGLNGRNGHVYPGAAAGPDGTFHVIYRHGPAAKVWHLASRDGAKWSGGPVPISDEEGPRIAVSSTGRVLAAAATGEMVELRDEEWIERGRPVGGEQRSPPSLAADRAGNIYATHGGAVSVLRAGSDEWTRPQKVPHFVRRRPRDQSAHLADGLPAGTVLVYEGADALYGARISATGSLE